MNAAQAIVVTVLAAVASVVLGTSAFAQGTVGIRLVDAPVDRVDDPRAHAYIVDHLQPGATISRRVAIINTTPSQLEVDLYAGAASVGGGGWSTAPGRARNELTGWVEVEPSRVEVPAGGEVLAAVTIEVPSDARPGERYAVIWAQPPSSGGDIDVVNRVGVRIYLSVGEGGEPPSDFEIDNLTASTDADGTPIVSAEVRNTGLRALDLLGELTLEDGPAGLSAGPFSTDGQTTLGPGDTGSMSVELDSELPSGPWLARMVARSGTLEKAVEASIAFPEAVGESAEPVEAVEVPFHQDRGFLIPLAMILTFLTLILLFLAWWFLISRRRRDEDEEGAPRTPHEIGVGR